MDAEKKVERAFNRRTGEVALPEVGEGVFIRFTMRAMEQLETAYGDDWVKTIIGGLAKMKTSVYLKVIACTLQNSTDGEIERWGLTWEELNIIILDALNLAIYGKTYGEQKAINEAQILKQIQDVRENPQLAAALSLMNATPQEPDQD